MPGLAVFVPVGVAGLGAAVLAVPNAAAWRVLSMYRDFESALVLPVVDEDDALDPVTVVLLAVGGLFSESCGEIGVPAGLP